MLQHKETLKTRCSVKEAGHERPHAPIYMKSQNRQICRNSKEISGRFQWGEGAGDKRVITLKETGFLSEAMETF